MCSPNSWVGYNWEWIGGQPPFILYLYSLYWAAATLATVGYGDLHPVSPVEASLATVGGWAPS